MARPPWDAINLVPTPLQRLVVDLNRSHRVRYLYGIRPRGNTTVSLAHRELVGLAARWPRTEEARLSLRGPPCASDVLSHLKRTSHGSVTCGRARPARSVS